MTRSLPLVSPCGLPSALSPEAPQPPVVNQVMAGIDVFRHCAVHVLFNATPDGVVFVAGTRCAVRSRDQPALLIVAVGPCAVGGQVAVGVVGVGCVEIDLGVLIQVVDCVVGEGGFVVQRVNGFADIASGIVFALPAFVQRIGDDRLVA